MNLEIYDNKPQFPDGIDPRTAAHEFRTLLAAGGKSQGIVAQLATLRLWAETTGRKIGANCDISQARIGGLEHYVWPDENEQVVRKFTYGGMFGRTVRDIKKGLVPATPLEYLIRWANHNDLFPPITKISGVMESDQGGLAILLEQTFLLGDMPALAAIEEFLRNSGYVPIENQIFAWKNMGLGFALFDARPANFVSVSNVPIPFDLVVVPLEDLR
jgi:hypothetical protein